jgi:hypothetical protein
MRTINDEALGGGKEDASEVPKGLLDEVSVCCDLSSG